MGQIFGGSNELKIYYLGTNINESTGTIFATALQTAILTLNQNYTTAIAGHELSANLEVTITHDKVDATFVDFMANYASPADTNTEKYEDATIAPGVAGSSQVTKYLLGVVKSGSTGGKALHKYVVCKAQVGAYTQEAEKSIRPETKLIGVKNKFSISLGALLTGNSIATDAMGLTTFA